MPINDDKDLKSSFVCDNCHGDGEFDMPSYSHPPLITDDICKKCKGEGFIEKSSYEWFSEKVKKIKSDNPGLYTFEDMMRAFQLGVLAESGGLSHRDYIGAEALIEKYFKPTKNYNE